MFKYHKNPMAQPLGLGKSPRSIFQKNGGTNAFGERHWTIGDIGTSQGPGLESPDATGSSTYDGGEFAQRPISPMTEASGLGSAVEEYDEFTTKLGPGRRLDSQSRTTFERVYGTSFSNVQLHTDRVADATASRIHARAFTYGEHIGFARGQYQPGSLVGDVLLAHELAHVQQQRDASRAGSLSNDMSLEHDANRAAAGSVLSEFGFESARPQVKSGLRLSRCGVAKEAIEEYKTVEEDRDTKISDGIAVAAQHVPELQKLYNEKMKSPDIVDSLGGDFAHTAVGANTKKPEKGAKSDQGRTFSVIADLFEEKYHELHISPALRGVVLLHELLHQTHDEMFEDIYEGQGWGLEVALYHDLKESDAWGDLRPEEQKTIDERIERLNTGDEIPERRKHVKKSAVMFMLLLHQVRGFDQPDVAPKFIKEMKPETARALITELVDRGFDFGYLKDVDISAPEVGKKTGLSEDALRIVQWIDEHENLDPIYTKLVELGPRATAAADATAAQDAKAAADKKATHEANEKKRDELYRSLISSYAKTWFIKGQEGKKWKTKSEREKMTDRTMLETVTKHQTLQFYRHFTTAEDGTNASSHAIFLVDYTDELFVFDPSGHLFCNAKYMRMKARHQHLESIGTELGIAFKTYQDAAQK